LGSELRELGYSLNAESSSPWGVSEKLSEPCKGNFVGEEGGSLGMRRDEEVDSSHLGGEIEEMFGEGRESKGKKRPNKFSRFLQKAR
jgi:hypothetical protein